MALQRNSSWKRFEEEERQAGSGQSGESERLQRSRDGVRPDDSRLMPAARHHDLSIPEQTLGNNYRMNVAAAEATRRQINFGHQAIASIAVSYIDNYGAMHQEAEDIVDRYDNKDTFNVARTAIRIADQSMQRLNDRGGQQIEKLVLVDPTPSQQQIQSLQAQFSRSTPKRKLTLGERLRGMTDE